jgi:hypothetical protein
LKPRPGASIVDDTGTRCTVLAVQGRAVRCRETYADGSEKRISMDTRAWALRVADVNARIALMELGP